MALTRLNSAILSDGKMASFCEQITRLLRQQKSSAAAHSFSLRQGWRIPQHQHRTFSHMTRSHDYLVKSHMTTSRTCLLLSPQTSTNLQFLNQRRLLNVSVTGVDEPLSYIPTPVECCYELLEHIHEVSAMPWWLTILTASFLFRGAIVVPFSIWQHKVLARIENVQPEINAHAEHIRQQVSLAAKELNWSKKEMAQFYSQQVKNIVHNFHFDHRCQSRKLFYVGFMQMGVWTTVTMAIGQMTGTYPELFMAEPEIDFLPELTTQGTLWFADMCQSDLLIPIMLGVVNLALVELWSLRRGPLTLLQHRLAIWFRLVSIGMIPVATMMPAAVSFFWLSSSLAGMAQFALLKWPMFRRFFDIPPSLSEMKHPLKELKQAFRIRYFSKRVF
ncbi:cytochrome c oxidase assembly protein COX18, mitochondrial-like [Asterias amurensis]|uniref:cytochrome c oxidase assembly protein COX18, mitochondrial-like n=1 Tax=Asterias amurensis TaxID=7602 RepID=UPI003AB7EBC2